MSSTVGSVPLEAAGFSASFNGTPEGDCTTFEHALPEEGSAVAMLRDGPGLSPPVSWLSGLPNA